MYFSGSGASVFSRASTGFLIMFSIESCAVIWWGCFLDLNSIEPIHMKRGKRHRKQSVWVTHTRLWHKAELSLQTWALYQYVHSTVFCIKILRGPMLYALGSKSLHCLHEEEWEAGIAYPWLASCVSVSLSFDSYHCQFVLLPISLNCKNKQSQSSAIFPEL